MPQKTAPLRRDRQTKIVATLGPSSNTEAAVSALFAAGVDVFRLNFSHGEHKNHAAMVRIIRKLEKSFNRPIGIIADLQGPKLRIGKFAKGKIALKAGQSFRFDMSSALGDEKRVNLPHPEVLKVLKKDSLIFLDDGKVRARVIKKGKDFVEVKIAAGSALSNNKGLNVPGVFIPIPALTAKDRKDLAAALKMGVDWIAQSFVQTPEDVKEARKLIKGRAALMVKLEKPSALEKLEEIIALADGIMLARGDLGVEIPPEDVPSVQKRVVRRVREQGKPVIVATQMLESMITNSRPTRAEASDVATAVYDGADAVMLSAETAAGDYPVKAVEIMDRICRRTEEDETYHQMMALNHPDTLSDPSDAITTAAYYVAQDVDAAAIVTYTMSGSTVLRMARQRPEIPVLCLTPKEKVARRLTLSYGVHAVYAPEIQGNFSGPVPHACRILQAQGIAKKKERFVLTAGVPFGTPGSTNILRIAEVE
jgi:pyruvate kinase